MYTRSHEELDNDAHSVRINISDSLSSRTEGYLEKFERSRYRQCVKPVSISICLVLISFPVSSYYILLQNNYSVSALTYQYMTNDTDTVPSKPCSYYYPGLESKKNERIGCSSPWQANEVNITIPDNCRSLLKEICEAERNFYSLQAVLGGSALFVSCASLVGMKYYEDNYRARIGLPEEFSESERQALLGDAKSLHMNHYLASPYTREIDLHKVISERSHVFSFVKAQRWAFFRGAAQQNQTNKNCAIYHSFFKSPLYDKNLSELILNMADETHLLMY